ncbi:PadR family transcriptional regulator [Nocardia sp. NBC_01388]
MLILRHITRSPVHGYELRKHVEQDTGITLNNNAPYPALRRFEDVGAVTKTSEQQQGRPARTVYTLTPVGRELLPGIAPGSCCDVRAFARLPEPSNGAPAEGARGGRHRVGRLLRKRRPRGDILVGEPRGGGWIGVRWKWLRSPLFG